MKETGLRPVCAERERRVGLMASGAKLSPPKSGVPTAIATTQSLGWYLECAVLLNMDGPNIVFSADGSANFETTFFSRLLVSQPECALSTYQFLDWAIAIAMFANS